MCFFASSVNVLEQAQFKSETIYNFSFKPVVKVDFSVVNFSIFSILETTIIIAFLASKVKKKHSFYLYRISNILKNVKKIITNKT